LLQDSCLAGEAKTLKTNPAVSARVSLRYVSRAPILLGRHIPELDSVRGIAISLVLVFHCSSIVLPETPLARFYVKVANVGWIGVDLFFVLSGFLITAILIDTYDRQNYFRSFYTRRILRIFPLYYVSIALWTLAVWLLPSNLLESGDMVSTLSYWFYLQNWLPLFHLSPPRGLIHFWSLAVEEQFYLIWPFLIRFTAKRGTALTLCVVTIAGAAILRAMLVLLGFREVAFYFTFSRIDALAIGACVAVYFGVHGTLAPFRRAGAVLFLTASTFVLLILVQQQGFYNLNPIILLVGVLPLNLTFGGFLIILLTSPAVGLLRRLFRNPVLRFLGKISYGIYVFHWPIMLIIKEAWSDALSNFWLHQITFLASVTIGSVALAYLSFRYLETPILNQKDKWAPLNPELRHKNTRRPSVSHEGKIFRNER
jgi:peptidoglycan/LPS O-acetylase OafA/YrhL